MEATWDFADNGSSNVVDQYVASLRKRIDAPFGRHDAPFGRHDLETVRAGAAPGLPNDENRTVREMDDFVRSTPKDEAGKITPAP